MDLLSESESRRFGWRVGRIDVPPDTSPSAARALIAASFKREALDVVIVRASASVDGLALALGTIAEVRCIHADNLLYWQCDQAAMRNAADRVGAENNIAVVGPDELDLLVQEVFANYRSHYMANPLFTAAQATDGYREWALTLQESGALAIALRSREGVNVAFGLLDWRPEPVEVRLAGVVPASQGQGLYAVLLSHLMVAADAAGSEAMRISTQAHNIRVMRVWARLGWLPLQSLVTLHVVRAGALQSYPRG